MRCITFFFGFFVASSGLVACKSNEFKGGGGDYATGANRNGGDSTKEDLMNNSAFGDKDGDGSDGDDSGSLGNASGKSDKADLQGTDGDEDSGDASAPDSSVDVIRLCSNKYSQAAGTNLKAAANGAVVSLIPTPDNTKARPYHFHSAAHATRIRNEIMNLGAFKLPLQKVHSGSYMMVVCDAANGASCTNASAALSEPKVINIRGVQQTIPAGINVHFGSAPGILGAGLVRVKGGKLTDLSGAFIPQGKAQLMEVLTDKNSEDNVRMKSFFNTFSALSGAGTQQQVTQEELDSIQDCDQSVSPLLIDLGGKGLELSPPFPGVAFDIDGDGTQDHISWPETKANAFLALDLNGNGKIDDGKELFGNNSLGPDGKTAENGFAALAKYDDNKDRVIDAKDEIYGKLRLWLDDGDGVSRASELVTLDSQNVESIDLAYLDAKEKDQYANLSLQRSAIRLKSGVMRMIVDVWFRVL